MHRLSIASTALILACLFSSCSSNPRQKRIAQNPELFNALSAQQKTLVQAGKISRGMDKKAVYLSWGDPSRSSKGNNSGTSYERWYYYNYTPYYTGAFYGGYGYGRRGYYGTAVARGTDYNSELEAKVEFRKGLVHSWEDAR